MSSHTIEVHLAANVEKYQQGMDAAKKSGSESMGFIASIFDKIKSLFGSMWDSFRNLFSSVSDKSNSSFGSMSADLDKTKGKMGETEEKTNGLITRIGIYLVAAFVAATAAISVFVKRGLDADAALARMAISHDIAASQISRFEEVALRSGVSVKDFAGSMGKLQDEMKKSAAGDGNSIFDKLGVKVVDANNALLKTDEVTIEVAKKIAGMSSEAEKYAAAAKIGFEGKVQVLEDIAHASSLVATTTDDQAAAVVRLGKIWHEILPGGKSMWAEISTFLTRSLTPAMTEASLSALDARHTIVDAFNQIFSAGSMFSNLGDKIKEWGLGASKWFDGVAKSATAAAISVMQFVAGKTGLGNPGAYVKPATPPGFVPGTTALASGNNDPIVTDEQKKQADAYAALTKSINEKIEAQKFEIQTGAALTEGQKLAIKFTTDLRDGNLKMTDAEKVSRTEQLDTLIAQEKINKQMQESRRKAGEADPFDAAFNTLGKEVGKLDQMNESLGRFEVASEHAKRAEIEFQTTLGNLGDASPAKKAKLQEMADAFDAAANKKRLFEESLRLNDEGMKAEREAKAITEGGAKAVNEYTEALAKQAEGKLKYLSVTEQATYVEKAHANMLAQANLALAIMADSLKNESAAALADIDAVQANGIATKFTAEQHARLAVETMNGSQAYKDAAIASAKQADAMNRIAAAAISFGAEWKSLADRESDIRAASLADTIGTEQAKAIILKRESDRRIELMWAEAQFGIETARASSTGATAAQEEAFKKASDLHAKLIAVTDHKYEIDFKIAGIEDMSSLLAGMSSAAAGMGEGFKSATTALSGLSTAMSRFASIEKDERDTGKKNEAGRLGAYADMAGAAKGFFKEHSAGYKAMEGAEKAFHTYQMAMEIKTMVEKSGIISAFTGLFTASKVTQLAVEGTTTTASVGLAGTQASAWGITAVVKAIASMPYPMNLVAGAMTLAAVVAIGAKMMGGLSGSGGDTTAKDRQAAAGTGSILGDSSAKSDSIARSIALTSANSSIELTHTAAMVASLRAIESSIGNLGNLLVRGGTITGAVPADTKGSAGNIANMGSYITSGGVGLLLDKMSGGFIGKSTAKLANAVFGGNTSAQDTGLQLNSTSLGSVLTSGVSASQYTDMHKDGGMFSHGKDWTNTSGIGAEGNDQLSKIVIAESQSVDAAAKLLGIDGATFTKNLNGFVVDIGKISLKGLSADQIQKQLETVFAKLGDDMAKYAVGGLSQFQHVGEGAFETLSRIASDYANLNSILESNSMTFGAMGMSSIKAREDLIDLAGGIDKLAGYSSSFASDFMSEAERLAPVKKYVTDGMAALGLAGVTTRDQFKNVVQGLNLSTVAGQKQYVAMMELSGAFAKAYAAAEDLTKSTQAIADERKDLQSQLDQLTMSSAQLLAKQRMALDVSNRGLFDQIQALTAAKAAQDAAKTSLGDVISRMKTFGDSARALHDGLLVGQLTTLTPMQQYDESRRQLDAAVAAARNNDVTAQGQVSALQTAFLTISQKVNGGDAKYQADFASGIQTADELSKWATGQVDVAQASLNALNAQVLGLGTLNDTMHQVAQEIANLPGGTGGLQLGEATPITFHNYGKTESEPLVAEIKALRAEVAGLRADQNTQTGDGIASNEVANNSAASQIVTGVSESIEKLNHTFRNYKNVIEP